jgi:hypothetical protein
MRPAVRGVAQPRYRRDAHGATKLWLGLTAGLRSRATLGYAHRLRISIGRVSQLVVESHRFHDLAAFVPVSLPHLDLVLIAALALAILL